MRALVVDDSPVTIKEIKDVLEANNFEVETADNGAAALDKYVKFKPDFVTLNVMMPVMDGVEALTRLLRLDKNARVIMITAVEDHRLVQKCLDRGAIGFITKPFHPHELIDTLTNVLKDVTNKNVVVIFNRLTSKIEEIFEKIGGINVTVSMKDIQIDYAKHPSINISELHKIRVVSVTQDAHAIPEGLTGYVAEIIGQQTGAIVTWIIPDELNLIRKYYVHAISQDEISTIESINIFSNKVLTELINSTGLRLELELVRPYDETKDKEIGSGKDLTKVKYEIIFKTMKIQMVIHLYFNTAILFRNTF